MSADALVSVFCTTRIQLSLLVSAARLAIVVDTVIDCAYLASVCTSAAVISFAALRLPRDTQVAWRHAGGGFPLEELLHRVNLVSTMSLTQFGGEDTCRRRVPGCRCGPDGQNSDEARSLEENVGDLHGGYCFLVRLFCEVDDCVWIEREALSFERYMVSPLYIRAPSMISPT